MWFSERMSSSNLNPIIILILTGVFVGGGALLVFSIASIRENTEAIEEANQLQRESYKIQKQANRFRVYDFFCGLISRLIGPTLG